MTGYKKKPDWLRIKTPGLQDNNITLSVIRNNAISTVCEEALCPNINECWNAKTATFLIMGNICTRNCGFCNIHNGCPIKLDEDEPEKVAQAVFDLGIKYVVITSVTRDDLPDQGARHFVRVIDAIREKCPQTKIEILTPDFQDQQESIKIVADAVPNVFAHNIEIVQRLHHIIKKPPSQYNVSINFLKTIKDLCPQMIVKTGLIVGVGENEDDILATINDLAAIKVDILTIGQYLAPSSAHFPVVQYILPEQFEAYKKVAEEKGIRRVVSGALVRSSYKAAATFDSLC